MMPAEGLKFQLHAFMTGDKPQSTVKSMGVDAGLVSRELRRSASPLPRQIKGIFNQGIANSPAPICRTDADRFNLGTPGTFVAEARNKGQLQASNDSSGIIAHDQGLAGIAYDRRKGITIGLRQGIAQLFPSSTQWIIGQKGDNGRKINNQSGAKSCILGHMTIKVPLENMEQPWFLNKLKTQVYPERVSYA